MKNLVLIHGRSQEGKDPAQLKWTWVNAWREGLAKKGLTVPIPYDDISFPYYGDALDEVIYGDADNFAATITRGPADSDELMFKGRMIEALRVKAGLTDDQVLAMTGFPSIEKGPMNSRWVRAILRAFDKYVPGMSGVAINLFTHDVYVYLKRPGVRDQVDGIVRAAIPDGDECVVVGHSLGSVVGYSVLKRDQAKLSASSYITVGSPLAIDPIHEAFHPVGRPACLAQWYNALDPVDIVALFPLEPPHFVVQPPIENKTDLDNFTSNHHGIVGYLSDADVAKKIYDAVGIYVTDTQ